MYTRFPFVFFRFFQLLLLTVMLSCNQPADREEQIPETTSAPIAKIVYEVRLLSDSETGSDLIHRTVYFDGTRSASSEQTSDYGFPGITTRFASGRDSVETYVKSLPYCTFRMERERVRDPIHALIVRPQNGRKNILGHPCRNIVLETEQFRYSVWYAEEVTVQDPTQAVVQHPNVPGLILEMEKSLKGKNDRWRTRTSVLAFQTDSKAGSSVLEVPEKALKVNDPNEALAHNRAAFEQAMQREQPLSWEQQQLFLGKWQSSGQERTLQVERFGEAYTFLERRPHGTTKGIARFYGNRLLLEQGTTWRTYFLNADGNLQSDQEQDIVLRKR